VKQRRILGRCEAAFFTESTATITDGNPNNSRRPTNTITTAFQSLNNSMAEPFDRYPT
jgi:hypothetical protein